MSDSVQPAASAPRTPDTVLHLALTTMQIASGYNIFWVL